MTRSAGWSGGGGSKQRRPGAEGRRGSVRPDARSCWYPAGADVSGEIISRLNVRNSAGGAPAWRQYRTAAAAKMRAALSAVVGKRCGCSTVGWPGQVMIMAARLPLVTTAMTHLSAALG